MARFYANFNPPEVGILAVSRSNNVLAKEKDKILEKTLMPLALSYDHRVINGVDAGQFMQELKNLMEDYS